MEKEKTPILNAQIRDDSIKINQLRRDGMMPMEAYGHKKANQHLVTNAHEFAKIYRKFGESTLFELHIEGGKNTKVLIHDLQVDVVNNLPLHADLYLVNLKEKLKVNVPLHFTGSSEAVDSLGGTLVEVRDEVEVECLPDNLVHEFNIDISKLATFEDTLTIADIIVPEGVVILHEQDEVIASIVEPRSEEEMAELEEGVEEKLDVESDTKSGTDKPVETEEKTDKKSDK